MAPIPLRLRDALAKASCSLGLGQPRSPLRFEERMVSQHTPVEGGDGYLFHQDHDTLEQLSGRVRFQRSQLKIWRDTLCKRHDWCARHGTVTRTVIIPEKHVVYADLLPPRLRISRRRPVMQLLRMTSADPSHSPLYPQEALVEARAVQPVFFRTDTHWTSFGAYVAYRAILGSLRPEIELEAMPAEQLAYEERRFTGDLGVRYIDERHEHALFLKEPKPPFPMFANNRYERGAVHVYENLNRGRPTCVIFRDSFSHFLMPYLIHSFSRVVAVSSVSAYYDLLELERPDVALFVTIERFLATFWQGQTLDLPQDLNDESFEAFTQTRFEELRPAAA